MCALFVALLSSGYATATEKTGNVLVKKAERPQFCQGDWWSYYLTEGAVEKRVKAEFIGYDKEGNTLLQWSAGDRARIIVYTPNHNEIRQMTPSGRVFKYNTGERELYRFPLLMGKSWSARYNTNADNVWKDLSIFVTGIEEVTVPAGTFSAFALYALTSIPSRTGYAVVFREHYWYVPEVKRVVLWHSAEWNGRLELVGYHTTSC